MVKILKNIFFSLVIFCLFFLLLEGSLRIAGWIYYNSRIKEKETVSRNKAIFSILCLGDSFTFGSGTQPECSYPKQLERMLNSKIKNNKFVVYNIGGSIPGINTSLILNSLNASIHKYEPKIIIVLAGMHNNWNLHGSNYFLFASKNWRMHLLRLDGFLTQFRIYKFLEISLGNLQKVIFNKAQESCVGSGNSAKDNTEEIQARDGAIAKEIEYRLKLAEQYYFRLGRPDFAIVEFQKIIELNPAHEFAHSELGCIYENQKKDELAINEFKKVSEINLHNLFVRNRLYGLYVRKGQNKLALKEIEDIEKIDTSARNLSLRAKFGLSSSLKDINDKEVQDNLLRYDLGEIIKLAKSYGTNTILLSYPGSNERDSIRRKTADRYGAVFIDIYSAFQELKPREKYFVPDGHCNFYGYEIMAQKIFNVLHEKKLIPEKQ